MSTAPLPSFGLQYRDGSHTGPAAPAACRACGRQMRLGTRADGFDSTTGKAHFVPTARCSVSFVVGFFDQFRLRFHDRAEQDFHGDWPWL